VIVFVTTREGDFGIVDFLAGAGQPVADRIRVLHYEDVASLEALPAASYVFSALDQLLPTERELVGEMRARLAESGRCGSLLNEPGRTLVRPELLEQLYASGRNSFRAVPATERSAPLRFPVFVRDAVAHDGSLTELLPDRRRLQSSLLRLAVRGYRLSDLLVVEFCDTSNADGTFRKYGAFVLGDRVIARSLNVATAWMTKRETSHANDECAIEETAYVEANPHADWLAETFALAGTDYGRMDYGVGGSRPQTWEINLNPTIGRGRRLRREADTPERQRARELSRRARALFYDQFIEAWHAIDHAADPRDTIAWHVSAAARAALEQERRERQRRLDRRRSRDRLIGARPIRAVRRLLRPR